MGEPRCHLGEMDWGLLAGGTGCCYLRPGCWSGGRAGLSPRNATVSPLVRQHLWAFKVAVETGLLVTRRSLLLSRQGPPIPAGGGPPPRAAGAAQLPVSVEEHGEDMAVHVQEGGLG